ncbi:ATP-binding protein [uncultured Paraglaciecola sp.]|jgi:signal transduction histidine kinase|uniref:ATP-binding protein n=1 Tax=uncultured Paraglaciecola sp. TaxID=1765024 RepID=UPI0025FD5C99|nr:ATP-binding protein [uncultured Paraglaciecola sp.]
MKKLTLSLIVAILTAIIFLGWGLDTFFNEYQEQKDTDEYSAYRKIIAPLANTLDKTDNFAQFVTTWQNQNQQQLTLTPLAEFPLPASLRDNFSQGEPLVLESEELITVNQLLLSQQQVLTLNIQQQSKQEGNLTLQVALTTVFYAGILLCVFIWLYPLIKRLRLLRSTAKNFGEGDFSERIHISSTSYIVDIENEFNRMAEKIETLVEDNKLLSNAVSHDLRTPLARLRFGIEALSETNKPETKEKYIQHLSQDIQEMENLVGVLLDYARLDQKMINVERLPLNLNTLIEGCARNLTSSDSSAVSIDVSGLSKIQIIIDGNENYLSMLINNLLSNAQRYAVKHVRITTKQTTTSLIMCVSDDGPGIPVEKRGEIFKPFIRGENQIEQKGYGMGLAIVARIAVWHGAHVVISQSDELGGAKFTITFKRYNK